MSIGTPYWHVHHDVLAERLTVPVEERIAFIRCTKPRDEVETRLRLLRPVQDVAVYEAYETVVRQAQDAFDAAMAPARVVYDTIRDQTWMAYGATLRQVRETYDATLRQAWEVYKEAVRPAKEALEALHRTECPDCPWDGATIFPVGYRMGGP